EEKTQFSDNKPNSSELELTRINNSNKEIYASDQESPNKQNR
ncbi:5024_t:CDS:1, partial [Acaulospora morrowiae]